MAAAEPSPSWGQCLLKVWARTQLPKITPNFVVLGLMPHPMCCPRSPPGEQLAALQAPAWALHRMDGAVHPAAAMHPPRALPMSPHPTSFSNSFRSTCKTESSPKYFAFSFWPPPVCTGKRPVLMQQAYTHRKHYSLLWLITSDVKNSLKAKIKDLFSSFLFFFF